MKKFIILLIAMFVLQFNSIAQKTILYNFEKCVTDSLQQGIKWYSKQYNKTTNTLKLYAVIIENDNFFDIYLQDYINFPKSGFLDLIKSTNRKIKVGNFFIPIIFPADILSNQIKSINIAAIPLSGDFIRVGYLNYKQQVVKTSILF